MSSPLNLSSVINLFLPRIETLEANNWLSFFPTAPRGPKQTGFLSGGKRVTKQRGLLIRKSTTSLRKGVGTEFEFVFVLQSHGGATDLLCH